jgi:hypothetical protein
MATARHIPKTVERSEDLPRVEVRASDIDVKRFVAVASTCLTYLCFKPFRSGSCPTDAEFVSRLEQNLFLDHAAWYWGEHVANVQEVRCQCAYFRIQIFSTPSFQPAR